MRRAVPRRAPPASAARSAIADTTDELPFAVGMVADGPEPVQGGYAECGYVIAVGTAPDGRLA